MDLHWQGTIEIAAPVERGYAYLADVPRHCEWAQTLERMEQRRAGDARGVGAVYRAHERQAMHADRPPRGPLPPKAFKGTTECEVTELVPDRRIAWRAHPVPIGMGVHAELAFDLAPLAGGRTRLTQTIRMHQPWLPTQVFGRLVFKLRPAEMEAKARAQWQASLANVKAILEGTADQHAGATPPAAAPPGARHRLAAPGSGPDGWHRGVTPGARAVRAGSGGPPRPPVDDRWFPC